MFAMERKQNLLTPLILLASILAVAISVSRFDVQALNRSGPRASSKRLFSFPKIILWAWERPEDLHFIDRREVGVAFLAKTIYLRGKKVVVRPRFQPLDVPQGTTLIAVARIESDRSKIPELSPDQRAKAASAIAELAGRPTVAAIQIDFDAKSSERAFYRDLLYDLRRQLPDSMPLSITALTSWCFGDNWLSELPIDEAVPMLFRMGTDRLQVLFHLKRGGDFRPDICRHSLGVSTDEPIGQLPFGRRFYVFHPRSWSPTALSITIKEVQKWQ